MRRILLLALILTAVCKGFSQNCAQTLRLARSTYDQGRLHELPALMKDCLDPKRTDGFTKQEKVEAYKLLTMSYIYLEEPEKADSSMLLLLRTDPYFLPNENIDPQEFLGLYKTFRTDPVYRVGLKAGVAFSQPNVTSSTPLTNGETKYENQLGIIAGAIFEIPVLKKFVLNPEVLFFSRRFGQVDNINQNSSTAPEVLSWASIPVSLQYEFFKEKFKKNERKVIPYVSLGVQTDFLLSASQEATTERTGSATITPQTYDNSAFRKQIMFSALISAGVKIKAGPGLLVGEVRYAHGLTPVTDASSVFGNQLLTFNNYIGPSIYTVSSLAITVGYGYNIFKPKKLTRKVRTSIKKK